MTLAELRDLFEQRRTDAERAGYLAPVADLYAVVLEDLEGVDGITEDSRRMLTVKEAAALLGMSSTYCYDHSEEIGAVRLGGSIRFPGAAVEEYRTRNGR